MIRRQALKMFDVMGLNAVGDSTALEVHVSAWPEPLQLLARGVWAFKKGSPAWTGKEPHEGPRPSWTYKPLAELEGDSGEIGDEMLKLSFPSKPHCKWPEDPRPNKATLAQRNRQVRHPILQAGFAALDRILPKAGIASRDRKIADLLTSLGYDVSWKDLRDLRRS